MVFLSSKIEQYHELSTLFTELETDFKKITGHKNEELFKFSRKILRKIAESRDKDYGSNS